MSNEITRLGISWEGDYVIKDNYGVDWLNIEIKGFAKEITARIDNRLPPNQEQQLDVFIGDRWGGKVINCRSLTKFQCPTEMLKAIEISATAFQGCKNERGVFTMCGQIFRANIISRPEYFEGNKEYHIKVNHEDAQLMARICQSTAPQLTYGEATEQIQKQLEDINEEVEEQKCQAEASLSELATSWVKSFDAEDIEELNLEVGRRIQERCDPIQSHTFSRIEMLIYSWMMQINAAKKIMDECDKIDTFMKAKKYFLASEVVGELNLPNGFEIYKKLCEKCLEEENVDLNEILFRKLSLQSSNS